MTDSNFFLPPLCWLRDVYDLAVYHIVRNLCGVLIWWFGKFGKDHQIKTRQYILLQCTFGAKYSDRQTSILSIPTESQFTKFNTCQTFPLYSIYTQPVTTNPTQFHIIHIPVAIEHIKNLNLHLKHKCSE